MSVLGRIAYHGWYRPYWFCRKFFAPGGFVQESIDQGHGRRMRAAACRLPPAPVAASLHRAHYLTGQTFWHLSAMSAHTLARHTDGAVQPVFHSDGRLDAATVARLRTLFPAAEFVTDADQAGLLARHVPADRFPTLRHLWGRFVLLRKLLSVHPGRPGWNLFLDSDTLFFRRPEFLLRWYAAPARPLCLEDLADAYGYNRDLLDRLAGHPLPPRVNTGLIGLHSPDLPLDRLEHYARELVAAQGINHFLEQALTAMLLAERPFDYAPPSDYFIPRRFADCRDRVGAFHHYAGPARPWYYRHAWRLALAAVPS